MDQFEALACAHFTAKGTGNYNLDITLPASNVELVLAIGNDLSIIETVLEYRSEDGNQPEKIHLNDGQSVWLFAYLLPSAETASDGDIHLSFGMGAAEGGGSGTPVGMLRIRTEAIAGVPNKSLTSTLFPVPSNRLIPQHVLSSKLADLGLGSPNYWYILNGYLQESAQFLMVAMEGSPPQVAHLWNKEQQSAIKAGQGWGANRFICMITAAKKEGEGVFTFKVGDPRTDAKVVIGGPVT